MVLRAIEKQDKQQLKELIAPVLDYYAPLLENHGVQCHVSFRKGRVVFPKANRYSTVDRTVYSIPRKRNHSQYDDAHLHIEDQAYCIVQLRPKNTALNKDTFREYAFLVRAANQHGSHSRKREKIVRSIDNLLARKLKLLTKQSVHTVCTNTNWDILRYVFGNYFYKETAMGIHLDIIRFCFIALFLLASSMYFILT